MLEPPSSAGVFQLTTIWFRVEETLARLIGADGGIAARIASDGLEGKPSATALKVTI